mgnify:CR=1 FL=1
MIKPHAATSPTTDDGEALEYAMADVATAMADPSRLSMLCALMDGRAWTATELSAAAGIAPSTASAHMRKLLDGNLISCLSQGRHRYYRLAGSEIATLIETLMGVSMRLSPPYKCTTPVSLRKARTCYDHLAGEVAVSLYAFMEQECWLTPAGDDLTAEGLLRLKEFGAEMHLPAKRKIACSCLDWSERRPHLGGSAGAALLSAFERNGWLTRIQGYREVKFTDEGKRALRRFFKVEL